MTLRISKNGENITSENQKISNRQFRLWDQKGDQLLKNLKVLLIVSQESGSEIENLLRLAGVGCVVIMDYSNKSLSEQSLSLLIPPDSKEHDNAKARLSGAQSVNANVNENADSKPVVDKFIASFDVVVATGCYPKIYKALHKYCRYFKVKLFITDIYGLFGYFLHDVDFERSLFDKMFPAIDQYSIVRFEHHRPLQFYLTTALLRFQVMFNRKPEPVSFEKDLRELKCIISNLCGDIIQHNKFTRYYSELFYERSATTSVVNRILVQTLLTNITMNDPLKDFNVFYYDNFKSKFYLL